jgi:hypothetical protein
MWRRAFAVATILVVVGCGGGDDGDDADDGTTTAPTDDTTSSSGEEPDGDVGATIEDAVPTGTAHEIVSPAAADRPEARIRVTVVEPLSDDPDAENPTGAALPAGAVRRSNLVEVENLGDEAVDLFTVFQLTAVDETDASIESQETFCTASAITGPTPRSVPAGETVELHGCIAVAPDAATYLRARTGGSPPETVYFALDA